MLELRLILSGATPCTQKYTFLVPEHCKCVVLGRRHTNANPGKTILIQTRQYAPKGRPAYKFRLPQYAVLTFVKYPYSKHWWQVACWARSVGRYVDAYGCCKVHGARRWNVYSQDPQMLLLGNMP